MNDIERTLYTLKNDYDLKNLYSEYYSIKQAIDIAISALEKQISKYPMQEYGSIKEVGSCPNCKSHLMYEPLTKYCRWCGQKLNWEVE